MWPECVLSFILACMPGDSYCKQFRPLLLCPLLHMMPTEYRQRAYFDS